MKTYNVHYFNTLYWGVCPDTFKIKICSIPYCDNLYFLRNEDIDNPLSLFGITSPITFEDPDPTYRFNTYVETTLSTGQGRLGLRTKYNFSSPQGNPSKDLLLLSLPGHNLPEIVFDPRFNLITALKGKIDTKNHTKDNENLFTMILLEAPLRKRITYSYTKFYTFVKSNTKNKIVVVENNLHGLQYRNREVDIEVYNNQSNDFQYLTSLFESNSYSEYIRNRNQEQISNEAAELTKRQQSFNSRWS